VIFTINDAKSLTWYKWPSDITALSNETYESNKSGIGVGEEWFAAIFDGKVMGRNSSFDVLIDDKKFEIKKYDSNIRLGCKGTTAAYQLFKELVELFNNFKITAVKYINNELLNYANKKHEKIVFKGELSENELQILYKHIELARSLDPNNKLYKDPLKYSIDKLKIDNIYSDIDGIVLSCKKGFLIIPKSEYTNKFEYKRLSLGYRPIYKLIDIPNPKNSNFINVGPHLIRREKLVIDNLKLLYEYAYKENEWIKIKVELVKSIRTELRRLFSRRCGVSKLQRTNEFEYKLMKIWASLSGRPVIYNNYDGSGQIDP
jgi:hypothetical protein